MQTIISHQIQQQITATLARGRINKDLLSTFITFQFMLLFHDFKNWIPH